MKLKTYFIDASAWIALLDDKSEYHEKAQIFFRELLNSHVKLITDTKAIDETVEKIRETNGIELVKKFMLIIEESVMTLNLKVDWISKRLRKTVLNAYMHTADPGMSLNDYYHAETIERKNVDIIFSFNKKLQFTGLPIMPQ